MLYVSVLSTLMVGPLKVLWITIPEFSARQKAGYTTMLIQTLRHTGHWQFQRMTVCSFRLFKIKMGATVLNRHENRDSLILSTDKWVKTCLQTPGG